MYLFFLISYALILSPHFPLFYTMHDSFQHTAFPDNICNNLHILFPTSFQDSINIKTRKSETHNCSRFGFSFVLLAKRFDFALYHHIHLDSNLRVKRNSSFFLNNLDSIVHSLCQAFPCRAWIYFQRVF